MCKTIKKRGQKWLGYNNGEISIILGLFLSQRIKIQTKRGEEIEMKLNQSYQECAATHEPQIMNCHSALQKC